MEELKLYIVEFEENSVMKKKIYLFNYIVYNLNYCLIILITYNKCIFSINNGIQKA